jgi:hypothetical protein
MSPAKPAVICCYGMLCSISSLNRQYTYQLRSLSLLVIV